LVEFYAPWCGHCKKLEPEYDAVAATLKESGSSIKIGKVDATIETELASAHQVRGYPTLKFFRDGEPGDYDGPREAKGIEKWLLKKTGPSAVELSSEEAEQFIAKIGTQVVGYLEKGSEDAKTFFAVAAKPEFDEFDFGVVYVDSKVPSIKVHRDDKTFELDDADAAEEIAKFIRENAHPLVGEFGQTLFQRAQKDKKPLVAVFIPEASQEEDLPIVTTLAEEFRDIIFSAPSSDKQTKVATQWGASGTVFPTLLFLDTRPGASPRPIAFEETKEFNLENAREFVSGCLAGTEVGFRKSEPVPESDDGPVKVVVGSTFEKIVYDEQKDVFVEFYAPWCGHCKKLAPIWDELGKKLDDSDQVVIAKIDATANGFPSKLPVKGFPTLLFFKAGETTPIEYSGDRSFGDLEKFVVQHASKEIKFAEEVKLDESTGQAESAKDEL